MKPSDIHQSISRAIELHGSGDLASAEAIYRQVLQVQPNQPLALHFLGVIAHQVGRHELAVELITRAINAAGAGGASNVPAQFYNNLGEALRMLGRNEDAAQAYRKSLELNPLSIDAMNNLAIVLRHLGRFDEAIVAGLRVVELAPQWPIGYNNLANALGDAGRVEEAIAWYEKALIVDPHYAEAASNLGATFQENNHFSAAIVAFRRTLAMAPDHAVAWDGLATALLERRHYKQSFDARRRALELKPDFESAHSNLVFGMNYPPDFTPEEIFAEHKAFGDRYAALAPPANEYTNDPDPDRPLKIGFVSPDFRAHSVAFFIEPLLELRDRENFHITCYADVRIRDERTYRFQQLADRWREITGRPDEEVARTVRQDGIDILIDLAGHTSGRRMLTFACKPAPVQITYCGYPNTTGLHTMDYRLTDALADPPGETDRWHTEKLIRLPNGFLCYRPSPHAPAAHEYVRARSDDSKSHQEERNPAHIYVRLTDDPPMTLAADQHVTFGSFNKLAKITSEVVAAWAKILNGVSGARMLIKAAGLDEPDAARELLEDFAAHGIGASRIDLDSRQFAHADHMQMYAKVDIALDTFPYNGTTTTCDALWMGVPVVVLEGATHASRVGVGLLNRIGHGELVAPSIERYVEIAIELANERQRLIDLRHSLRGAMQASPLMDEKQFTRDFESALRTMWREYCRPHG